MANPNDAAYVPRPEWYFLFLFQLLKIFPGRLELIGTLVLPSLSLLCLALLPFLNRVHTRILTKRVQLIGVAALAFSAWSALTAAALFSDKHPEGNARISPSAVLWAQIPPEVIAGYGYFQALHCQSCHDLIVGTPKPGPILGLTGIQHPRDWMLQHFDDESHSSSNENSSTSLTLPERNALVVFVANLKPDLLATLLATSPQFINGAQTFVASACASCHKVNGIGGDSGPSLNGVFSRRSESWIRAHFAAPRKLSPGSIMPPYKFDQKNEQDLIKYLLSLPE
jgi:cytochrome c2